MWETKPISGLCFLAIDCVNKTAPLSENRTDYKMLRTTNVKSGFIDFESVRYVEEPVFKKWIRRAQPQYGDVLFTREAPAGEVGRFTATTGNYFLGQRLFLYRPDPAKLDWNYLAYVLQSHQIQGWVQGAAYGATVPHLAVSDMEHLKIPVPPINVQKKIGDILSAYDDLIENNLKRIKLLEEMAQITYEEWFVRLRFPGHESTPINPETGLPEGWSKTKLKSVLILKYGKALKADTRVEGDIPVYGSSGIVGTHNEALVKGCGIIVGRKGNVGSVFWSHDSFYPIDTVYFVTSIHTLPFIYFTLKNSKFDNSDAAVPGLNRDAAYAVEIILPPEAVEKNFSAMVQQNLKSIQIFEMQSQRLREARDILLPRLMTGIIDVESYNPSHLSTVGAL